MILPYKNYYDRLPLNVYVGENNEIQKMVIRKQTITTKSGKKKIIKHTRTI